METLSLNVDHRARRGVPACTDARPDHLIQRTRGDEQRQNSADHEQGHIH
jgi:hypothetical protein